MNRVKMPLGMIVVALAMLTLSACGGGTGGRYGVSGSVTFKGKPLQEGNILFISTEGSPTQAGGVIINGKYKIAAAQGLAPGKYKVSISAGDGKTPAADPDAPPGPSGNFSSKELIPPEYNVASKLEKEVKASGENVFDFDIK